MDTRSFLQKVLPSSGTYVLAEFWKGLNERPKHTTHTDIDSMVNRLLYVDAQGKNVYHACASFFTGVIDDIPPGPTGKPARSPRVARNAALTGSQWLDIDVGPDKDYATKRDALQALTQFCKQVGVPAPMIVSSGNGLHCYWVFTHDVPASDAKRYMGGFAAALDNHGFKHDSSRTTDLASVLRPVGSHHRKGDPKEIVVLRDAKPVDAEKFYGKFMDMTPPPIGLGDDDEWGTGGREYPPSEARRIAKSCPTLLHLARVGGNVEEPLWRNMLGLLKHTVEGLPLAIKWSKGHPDFSKQETIDKYESWSVGPPTCEQFASHCEKCEGCPMRGKIRSPIHLGYADPEQVPVPPEPETVKAPAPQPVKPDPVASKIITHNRKLPSSIPFWPKKYRWDGQFLCKYQKPEDPSDPGIWVPIFSKLLYPYMRYRNDDGEMQMLVSMQVNQSRGEWVDFEIPAKSLADNRQFNGALGAHEVYTMGDKGTVMARQFFQDVIGQMQELGIETQAHTNFGWHDDAFVVGTTAITNRGAQPVLLSDKVPRDANTDFGTAGTADRWAELVNTIYNREGAEPYQFMICAGFGAPLIKLMGSDLWHGIPIALTGEGGLGKTTTCMVACSMFGEPGKFAISTNELGSTMNALISRVGLMRHLPLVLDEMTGRKTEELQAMLYALSNGKPKERNRSDGSLIDTVNDWDTTTFITGNMNITSMLAQLDKHRAEATQLRCFEIPLDDGFNDRVFPDIDAKTMIEHDLLSNNYGKAGQQYIQYIIQHRKQVKAAALKMRAKFTPNSRDETRERFYYDCIATALVGGTIAKKLGLINFDLNAIKKWAMEHVKSLRTNRNNNLSTVEDHLMEFFTSLHGRTVTTEKFSDGRAGPKHEVDPRQVREPIARIAREDKVFLVANKHFTKWCSENNVHAKWLRDELDKRGIIKVTADGSPTARMSMFKGTSLPTLQTTCIQFDYDAVLGGQAGSHLKAVVNNDKTSQSK